MKKIIFIFLCLFSFPAFAKINIVTTIPDLAAIAQEVGGDLVDVKSIARGDQDPHFIEPKPSYAVLINRADLLIEVGLELEVGWLPVLLTQSRNPHVRRGEPGLLTASDGVGLLEIPSGPIDRSQGDIHPYGNPHYWLDPRNGVIIANHIADRLAQLDPPNAAAYQANATHFKTDLSGKIKGWQAELAGIRGKTAVTYHKSYSYFARWSGLQVADYIEPKPGIPPSPTHVLALIDLIKREKIPLIITENYYDPKPSHELAERTGAKVITLPTSVGGEAGIKSYFDLFDTIVRHLKEGA